MNNKCIVQLTFRIIIYWIINCSCLSRKSGSSISVITFDTAFCLLLGNLIQQSCLMCKNVNQPACVSYVNVQVQSKLPNS